MHEHEQAGPARHRVTYRPAAVTVPRSVAVAYLVGFIAVAAVAVCGVLQVSPW
jgi:hypothetical protein